MEIRRCPLYVRDLIIAQVELPGNTDYLKESRPVKCPSPSYINRDPLFFPGALRSLAALPLVQKCRERWMTLPAETKTVGGGGGEEGESKGRPKFQEQEIDGEGFSETKIVHRCGLSFSRRPRIAIAPVQMPTVHRCRSISNQRPSSLQR